MSSKTAEGDMSAQNLAFEILITLPRGHLAAMCYLHVQRNYISAATKISEAGTHL